MICKLYDLGWSDEKIVTLILSIRDEDYWDESQVKRLLEDIRRSRKKKIIS